MVMSNHQLTKRQTTSQSGNDDVESQPLALDGISLAHEVDPLDKTGRGFST